MHKVDMVAGLRWVSESPPMFETLMMLSGSSFLAGGSFLFLESLRLCFSLHQSALKLQKATVISIGEAETNHNSMPT